MSVFLDTSFLYARISPRDQWHGLALKAALPAPGAITTSLVVSETATLLQMRGFFSAALDFLRQIRADEEIEIVYPDSGLQRAGWEMLTKYGGAGANAIDCTSFAVMKHRSVRRAYTFDKHFRTAGFQILG